MYYRFTGRTVVCPVCTETINLKYLVAHKDEVVAQRGSIFDCKLIGFYCYCRGCTLHIKPKQTEFLRDWNRYKVEMMPSSFRTQEIPPMLHQIVFPYMLGVLGQLFQQVEYSAAHIAEALVYREENNLRATLIEQGLDHVESLRMRWRHVWSTMHAALREYGGACCDL